MDILAIRDKIRADEKVTATLVNHKGETLGTLLIEDMLLQLAGVDIIDFYGEFTKNPDCSASADCRGVSIDLGDGVMFAGGMLVIKDHKGWKDIKKLYQTDGARSKGVYFHAETMNIRDLEADEMPVWHDPNEEITLINSEGAEEGTLGDLTFDGAEVSGITILKDGE